ncbi:MAG: cation-transporting P-type ATPase [Synechococcales cyanobacterium]
MNLPTRHDWHALAEIEVLESWQTDVTTGLTPTQVQSRQVEYGPNQLTVKAATPAWRRFLRQFHQSLLYILMVAGTIKALLGSWRNAAVIWGVVLINAVISYVQEAKAEEAISALAKSVTTEATVLRHEQKLSVPSADLVPGDVVILNAGDQVPADLRLVAVRNLQTDESALTGESVPVVKQSGSLPSDTVLPERTNMAFAGSFVTFGQATGIVVAIGDDTQTGQISGLMEQQGSLETPLTRKFGEFSETLLKIILTLAVVTFGVGFIQGHWQGAALGQTAVQMFEAAVALAVSAIPEGLPAVVTVTLAIGVNRMAQRHAIIRKLPAVETLGGATVICSDKTGTLTQNQMTVQQIYAGSRRYEVSGGGYSPVGQVYDRGQPITLAEHPVVEATILAGVLCNDTRLVTHPDNTVEVVGDPTEAALLVVGQKVGQEVEIVHRRYPRQDSIPFESQYQYMATLHTMASGESLIFVKGSLEAILQRCQWQLQDHGHEGPLDAAELHRQADAMAAQGLRVLAFARKAGSQLDHDQIATDLTFLGIQGMIDPPRPEAISAVYSCQAAGIQVKMITGDHVLTAKAIAEQMGLGSGSPVHAYTGRELAQLSAAELVDTVQRGSVFARVVPEQKLRLVEALQAKGHVVAMTGDGVNDAPALRQADVGIAMGKGGTEVAKAAADMILTDDNFASIKAAVEEGRTVFNNLLKAIAFILPVNGGESMTILLSVLLGRELPILAIQVLWLNMLNSITMTVPLSFEPSTGREMQRPPRDPKSTLLSPTLLQRILLISVFNWILIFGVFEYVETTTGNLALARTMAIQALVMGRILYLLSLSQAVPTILSVLTQSRGKTGLQLYESLTDIAAMILGLTAAILFQILFSQWGVLNGIFETYPLTWGQWGWCVLLGLPMVVVAAVANRLDPN